MRGEGSAQKSIGEVGTRQTPRRRSFEERKRKKRRGGDDDDDDPDGKTAVSTQSLVDGRHRYKCMHTARAPFYTFSMHRGRKKIFRGGAYSSPHIISAQGEKEADPIVLLFSSFSINRHHGGCVCVCVCGSCFAFATSYCASKFLSIRREFSFLSWAMDNPRSQEGWRGGSREGIKTSIPFAPTLCPHRKKE